MECNGINVSKIKLFFFLSDGESNVHYKGLCEAYSPGLGGAVHYFCEQEGGSGSCKDKNPPVDGLPGSGDKDPPVDGLSGPGDKNPPVDGLYGPGDKDPTVDGLPGPSDKNPPVDGLPGCDLLGGTEPAKVLGKQGGAWPANGDSQYCQP